MRSVPRAARLASAAAALAIAAACTPSAAGVAAGATAPAESPAPAAGDSLGRFPEPLDPRSVRFWPTPMDTIFVTGRRPTRREVLARESVFASLLPVDEIRGAGAGVEDLLERAVGVQVQRYGGPGSTATVSLRGADPGQVEVFLDRTPLRSASRSVVDLGLLDIGQLQAIEVYRSAPPADLGGAATGAALRLVTPAAGRPGARLRCGAGSYGTREAAAQASGALSASARYLFSFSRFASAGDFRYHDDNGTPHEDGDDRWRQWSNGETERLSLWGRFTFDLPAERALDASTLYARRTQGIPGGQGRPTQRARLETSSLMQRVEARVPRLPDALEARLHGFAEGREHLYKDPDRELGLVGSPRLVQQEERRRGGGLHLRWIRSGAHRWRGSHAAELLLEGGREQLRQEPPPGRPTEDLRLRSSRLLSIGDTWDAWSGALRLGAFYRWQEMTDNYTGADPYRPFASRAEHHAHLAGPRLGVRVTLGRDHALKANYAHQGRFPSFAELFGYEGLVRGNPALGPEQGWRADLGWSWAREGGPRAASWRVEPALYQSELEEMIVFVLVSNRETKPFNLDRARIRGAEVDLSVERPPLLQALAERLVRGDPPALTLALHATIQDARDRGASPVYRGKQLTYHPPLQAHGRLEVAWRDWRGAYSAQYRSASYWSRSNLPEFQSEEQWRHDLELRRALGRSGLAAALRIENLTDAWLEDVRGYPLPGRSWFVEIDWALSAPAEEP